MLRRVIPLIGLVLLAAPRPAVGQAVEAGAFTLPGLGVTARAAALGGAPTFTGGADVGAFLHNPALLADGDDGQASLGYLDHLSSVRVGTVTYALSVTGVGMLAAGLRFLGWGAIPRTDETGATDGDFRAGELAFTLAGSRAYGERIRYGASVHLLRSGIDGMATGAVAADLGVVAEWAEHRLAVGASLHQLGVTFGSIGSSDDSLPIDVRVGVTKRLEHLPVLLTATAYGLAGTDAGGDIGGFVDRAFRHLLLGAEFQFSDAFQIRFGYDHRRHAALKIKSRLDFAGFSLGTGIRIRRVAIDYAWTSWSSLGGLHRFTVGTRL